MVGNFKHGVLGVWGRLWVTCGRGRHGGVGFRMILGEWEGYGAPSCHIQTSTWSVPTEYNII